MRSLRSTIAPLVLGLAAVLLPSAAGAATITVLSSFGMSEVINALAPAYQKQTGNTLVVYYDVGNLLLRRIAGGEPFDVAILPGDAMDRAVAGVEVDGPTRVVLARSGIGLAYKAGTPAPDVHDVDAFRRTILAARSVAYTTAGASGLYFISLCERLGIADQVKAKATVLQGGRTAELVASGRAALAAQQMSELLPVAGVAVVPFPPALQHDTPFVGALAAGSTKRAAGASLLRFLADPANAATIRAKGMEPG
ncbi:MAG TPA: substrate-binding domain-containing protein [Candidatus Sulfotelmatobacter sp.]|nr:substrate-binding domain-containing protein [Candidatus Sulfotelmatobacter sp.]